MSQMNQAITPVLHAGTGFRNRLGESILGGIGDMLQDIYKKKQVEIENKRKADELAMEKDRTDIQKQQFQFNLNRQQAADAERDSTLTNEAPPEFQTVEKAPAEQLDMTTPADAELGLPAQKATMPSFTQVEKKVPMRTKTFGTGPTAVTAMLDWGGKGAAQRKQEADIAEGKLVKSRPEALALLKQYGLDGYVDPATGVIPASVLQMAIQARREDANAERTALLEEGRDRRARAHEAAMLARADQSPANRKAAKDEETNAMIDAITPDDPSTIPPQYRDMVVAFAEGRGVTPRAGTNINLLQQMAFKYKPGLDMTLVNARKGLRADLAKGSITQRGGQITSLNTLANHLDKLESAADELAKSSLANSGSATVNWLAQKMTPSSTHAPIASYQEVANAVREEYIRALKGASPTETEIKEFNAIADPTLSAQERKAHIDALKDLAAGRANAQEDAFVGAFGVPSATTDTPMFGGGWVWDGASWRLRARGQKGKPAPRAAGAAKGGDSLGVR